MVLASFFVEKHTICGSFRIARDPSKVLNHSYNFRVACETTGILITLSSA